MVTFRKSVLQKTAKGIEGEVVISSPFTFKVYFVVVSVLVMTLFIVISLGKYKKVEYVTGYTSYNNGETKVYSPKSGFVTKKFISVRDKVKAGDPLFEIHTTKCTANYNEKLTELNLQLDSLENKRNTVLQLFSTNKSGLNLQIVKIKNDTSNINKQLDIKNKKIELQDKKKQAVESLISSKAIDIGTVISEKLAYLNLIEEGLQLELALENNNSLLQVQQNKLQEDALNKSITIDDINVNLSGIRSEINEIKSECSIIARASVDGIITTDQINIGDFVKNDIPLVMIVPKASLIEVTLLVPSNSIGNLKINNKVAINYDAYPFQYYGRYYGSIYKINNNALHTSEINNSPIKSDTPFYLIKVKLDSDVIIGNGMKFKLKSGISVTANIETRTENLLQWLFSPILTLKGYL